MNVVRFTVDGNYCLSAGDDRTVRLWNPHKDSPSISAAAAASAVPRALLVKAYGGVHGYSILDVAIASDNARFVSAGVDKALFVFDVVSGRLVRRIPGHTQKINAVEMNKEANVVLSASYDQTVSIWDLRSNVRDPIQTLRDFKDSVTSLAVTDNYIVATSIDGCLRTFDLRHGRLSVDSFGAESSLVCVRLTRDCKSALSMCFTAPLPGSTSALSQSQAQLGATAPATLRLTDLSTGLQLASFAGHVQTSYKSECGVCGDAGSVVAGSEDGTVHQWDLQAARRGSQPSSRAGLTAAPSPSSLSFSAHSHAVSSLSTHPTDPLLLSAGYDGYCKLWELSSLSKR